MYQDSSIQEINFALTQAMEAFHHYKNVTREVKASFLMAIADEMEALGEILVTTASRETHLPEGRIVGERGRTTGQLRMFSDLLMEGSWVEARVDTALPDRLPLPKPDIRKMLVPLGPVVVFGASNFPLAYSTAGGDTASALAAGCPVIVKGHPAHAETSQLVADCIFRALKKNNLPKGVFHHIHGKSFEVGQALVKHPYTKAVGFTGSFAGGKILFDLANQREEPIPVFSEMGSTNPVFIFPEALKKRKEKIADLYAQSITLGVGQFCTNPGLLLGQVGGEMDELIQLLGEKMKAVQPGTMLHEGIAENYSAKKKLATSQEGVIEITGGEGTKGMQAVPALAKTSLETFVKNPILKEEVFGPYSLVIQGQDMEGLEKALDSLPGQLTTTLMVEEEELPRYKDFINRLREKSGRLIFNSVPTGVEVCPSMQHGGPFPATTDSRFSSVGPDAIKRWVRPLAFQNCPASNLPEELQDGNPLKIWRMVNGHLEK